MQVKAIKTRVFKINENLIDFIDGYINSVADRTILVVTSKIVALSEGRAVEKGSRQSKANLIKQESELALPAKYAWLTIKNGQLLPSAGMDESNAQGKIILLPRDSFAAAQKIRLHLVKKFKLRHLGVVITDSRVAPLRRGITGTALGYAGFKGLKDYRGQRDIFGRRLKFSTVNVADCLATAAVLGMGEAAEQRPLAVITDVDLKWQSRINRNELKIALKEDLYYPLFKNIRLLK